MDPIYEFIKYLILYFVLVMLAGKSLSLPVDAYSIIVMASVLSVLNIITDYGIIRVTPILQSVSQPIGRQNQDPSIQREPMPAQVPEVKPSSRRCSWSNAQNGLIPDDSYGPRYKSLTAAFDDCDEDGDCQYVSQVQDPAGVYFEKGKGNLTPLSNQSKIPRSVITCNSSSFRDLPPRPPLGQLPPAEQTRSFSSSSDRMIPNQPSTVKPADGVCQWGESFTDNSVPITYLDSGVQTRYNSLEAAKAACDKDPSCAYVIKRSRITDNSVDYALSKLGDMITDKSTSHKYSSLKCTHSTASPSPITAVGSTGMCRWSDMQPASKIPSSINKDSKAFFTLQQAKDEVEKDNTLKYIVAMSSKSSPSLAMYYPAKGDLVQHNIKEFNVTMTECTRPAASGSQKGGSGGSQEASGFEGGILRVPKKLAQVDFLSRSIGDLINQNIVN